MIGIVSDLVVFVTVIAAAWTLSWKLSRSIAAAGDAVRKELKTDLKAYAAIAAAERSRLAERISTVSLTLSGVSHNVALIQGRQEGRAEEILRSARKESSFEQSAQPAPSQ